MEYDLTRLGARRFALLSADLIESVLAHKIPDEEIRDNLTSVISGRIAWPAGPSQQVWQGHAYVASIFFTNASQEIEKNWPRMQSWIEDQLNDWERNSDRLKWRGSRIEYFVYICNAELGFFFGSEIEQKINNLIQSRTKLAMKGFMVWDYGRLCRLLDGQKQLRRKYSGFISPDGILADLAQFSGLSDQGMGEIIARQLSGDLVADQWVRLGRTAAPDRQKLALSNVAIDLPISRETEHSFAAECSLSVGDQAHRPNKDRKKYPSHVVLVGGPGQGKTTIGQLVCQVYRTLLLAGDGHLTDEEFKLVASVQHALNRVGLKPPKKRRWPVRIELAAYADEDAKNNVSLLKYIADHVSTRSYASVSGAAMRQWLKSWPWLVVLDGLDEVPSQGARESLVRRISEFFTEAARAESDLLVIATTRPQGYTGEFSADRYKHIYLSPLEPDLAASYARRLAEVQHSSDPDLMRKLIERTQAAAREESTARLMRTPLQVTIMSLLLENRERAPSARYELFEAYYQAIYSREATKPGAVGSLLEELRPHIYALHDRVGLLLQAKAEGAGESDASLPQKQLGDLARERLVYEGFDNKDAERLAGLIVRAVTLRLVLIVPKGEDEAGFEVRSIQEFMAARALVSGKDDAILSRMRVMTPSSYWRNTLLFAAGRIFTEREHLRRDLVAVVEDIDSQDIASIVVAPGADLAVDMIGDDLTSGAPGLLRILARHALTVLHYPSDEELTHRADVIYRCANDSVIRAAIDLKLEECLQGKNTEFLSAYSLLEEWQKETGSLGLRSRQLITKQRLESAPDPSLRPWQRQQDRSRPTVRDVIEAAIQQCDLTSARQSLIKSTIDEAIRESKHSSENKILEVLNESPGAEASGQVALALMIDYPSASGRLRSIIRNWYRRRPVAEDILALTPYLPDAPRRT
jgi:hypothetical protein